MEFRKARFAKRSDRYPRNERTQGQQGSRRGGSRYGGSSRFSAGSRFNRGSDGRREMHEVICADCGNECKIPFRPKDSRPVYCRECFQDHKPQETSNSRFDRNDRSSRYSRDSDRGSRYGRGTTSRFEKDRTPIHSRDSFRKNKYQSNDFVSRKKNRRNDSADSDSFYAALRTKLFKILGGKKCANCGYDNERALGFAHIDDVESFDYGQRGGSASSWEKYVSEPELARKSLQILCLNCNQLNQK